MIKRTTVYIRTDELCQVAHCSTETVVGLVEYGVIEPGGSSPDEWEFEEQTVTIVRRAARLQQDFGTDIAGVALALDLLGKLEDTRLENRMLRQRLKRFLSD